MAGPKKRKRQPSYSTADVGAIGGRVPKAVARFFNPDGNPKQPIFSFALVDVAVDGEWGWHLLDEPSALRVVNFLSTISQNTWNEVRSLTGPGGQQQHRLHHDQPISSLCDQAQGILAGGRYEELGGEVFRFRLSPTERLWGFEIEGVFYVVWWDPNHRVYPTEPN